MPQLNARMAEIASQIADLQKELEREVEEHRAAFRETLKDGRRRFEEGVLEAQRRLRVGFLQYVWRADLLTIITAPVIYGMIVPIALLDLAVTVYQHICFRVYDIKRVRRREYVVFDRHRLVYLNWLEALNCAYCAYANGVFAYAREIASRTEQYWCPIKHALQVRDPHLRYIEFLEYGDAEGYRQRLEEYRAKLKP